MSVEYCQKCCEYIDTDFNAEHFDKEFKGCETSFQEEENVYPDDNYKVISKKNE